MSQNFEELYNKLKEEYESSKKILMNYVKNMNQQ